ncbi:MAG: translocation/assembly module TamB domain-containing protein [Burkholderiaceae bacterium]
MSTPAPATKTAPPSARRRVGFGWTGWAVATLVLVVAPAAVLAVLAWVIGSDRGTAWALAQQDLIAVEQPKGNLLDGFSAKRIVVRWGSDGVPARENRVTIEAPRVSKLGLAPGGARAWLRIHAAQVSADRVSVQLAPGSGAPKLPSDLGLGVELEVDAAQLGTLELPGLEAHPVRNASAHVHLGAQSGARGGLVHRADGLRFAIGPLQWRGRAQIGTEGALPLQVQLDVAQASDAPAGGRAQIELPPWAQALRQGWHVRLEASGPLARFATTLTLRAQGQRLDAQAEVALLEAWPLPRLDLRTEQLDLSALLADAPATALSGDVRIAPVAGAAGTLSARARLVNQRPGRWDRQALPVRSLAFDLRASPAALGRLEFMNVQALLADEDRDAGALQGSAEWSAGSLRVQARLTKVQPSLLDPRLPAMTLSGPINLSAQDLQNGQSGPGAPVPRIDLQAELDGRIDADPKRSVQLKVDVAGSAQGVEVRELHARAGAAQLKLSGTATRSAELAIWRLDGNASLIDFDPLPWFPGAPESAWRRGPHLFTGDAEFAFALPIAAQPPGSSAEWQEWLEWLPSLQGEARLTLHPSQLAGLALRGQASLKSSLPTPSPTRTPNESPAEAPKLAHLTARFEAGGNTISAQGQWASGNAGRSDRWAIELNAPQLARLAPLRELANVPPNWATPAGSLEAGIELEGRWPHLRTQGTLKAAGLRIAQLSVTSAQARWNFDTQVNSPFDLHVALTDARWEQQQPHSVRNMGVNLQGTTQDHSLDLRAALNAAPPAWAEFVLGDIRPLDEATPGSTLVQLQARGGLRPETDPASPPRWQGSVQVFDLRGSTPQATPLLRLQDLMLELQAGDAQSGPSFEFQPGRGELLGTSLRWERAMWRAASATSAAQFDVQAELGPVAVAPLLARAQPHFGWRGDLSVGGQVKLRSAPNFQAEVVLERLHGDLSVSDESATQEFQLTDLRIALAAQDGVWSFTQALAGKTLGEAAGAVTARLAPDELLPNADTLIQGVLEARVANLGTWGAWVPPGWRLAGNLRTSAEIGGRLGAPEYTGEIRGSGIGVRNVVQGVNVVDGEVDIKLQGESARIARFEAKAGGGSVRIQGGASLGEAPSAQLLLSADKFQLLGRVDRRIVTSGSAKLQLDAQTLSLAGRFEVDEGLIDFTRGDAPTLADDVRVTARPGAPEPGIEPQRGANSGAGHNVTLDLRVALGEQLRLRGRGLDTQLRGDLHLTNPAGKLAVNGTVRTAAGTYAAYGQKLSIGRGELVFTGALENPRLDIIATRPNLEQVVGVAVTGTALNPRVRLFSEPEMADIDKISWLVLGRPSDGLGRTETALLQRAALGLLAGEGTGPTDQLIDAVGLDEVSFRQGEGEVRETVVSLGKQLSRRWYVGYERGLNATTGNWQLIYRIAQRLTLRAQSGLDNSLDAIWTWRWQ